ncbi:MAG: nicotinamide-nucleotide adenylyltransferase [Aigarchaeota archaeon]|nr:nicotinamide-nucleotide adenylyltransferase [Aigarchaeota archaeon]MCX8193429.1 nicotinamide-nucleotide adenylyltransferase [Nitrososphaeria archaeon]MDW7985839.1 nicotinamide-nucleotide adenylyltransferase [Nitrososphaerota archaeon]
MKRGLFIGRFQPPHIGHLTAIKKILQECDEVIIGIGSAQFSYTLKNPFTAGERIEMIRLMLKEENMPLEKVIFVPIPDIGEHSLWVSRVKALTPRFDIVYSNNPLVQILFQDEGYVVKPIELYRRDELVGTLIRKKMIEDEDWREYVPSSVVEYIESIKGVERIKQIIRTDYEVESSHEL